MLYYFSSIFFDLFLFLCVLKPISRRGQNNKIFFLSFSFLIWKKKKVKWRVFYCLFWYVKQELCHFKWIILCGGEKFCEFEKKKLNNSKASKILSSNNWQQQNRSFFLCVPFASYIWLEKQRMNRVYEKEKKNMNFCLNMRACVYVSVINSRALAHSILCVPCLFHTLAKKKKKRIKIK